MVKPRIIARPAHLPQRDQLGEAPFWDGESQTLLWVDIVGRRAFRLHPESGGIDRWDLPQHCSAIVPTTRGDALVCLSTGVFRLDLATGETTPFATPDPHPGNRSNDAGPDPQGRLIYGAMQNNIGPNGEDIPVTTVAGGFWCIDAEGRSVELVPDVAIANIVAFSPDGARFYCADSMSKTVWSYAYDPEGPRVSDRQVFIAGGDGHPDGSSMDAEGCLWNMRWGAGRIVRHRPDGSVERTLHLPVAQGSSSAFGGPDLKTLYVTSARQGLAGLPPDSLDGSLFAFDLEVAGAPRRRFDG